MSYGPTIIYDKSVIQSLSEDEAFWLGMHFHTNLTPIFFAEVLADLQKPPPPGRTAEDVVRVLARKISQLGAVPNIYHHTLCVGEMLGFTVPMSR